MDVEYLALAFERITNKYNELNKLPNDFGTGTPLYRSEIHTIEAIGRSNGINITKLAAQLGVTKGSVSQNIDKLIRKGFVYKAISPETANEVVITLTEKGALAYQVHANYHREMYSTLAQYLDQLPPITLEALMNIIGTFEEYLDERKENKNV